MTTNRMFDQVQGQCRSMCVFWLLLHLNVDGNYLCVNRMFFQTKFKVAWGQAFAALKPLFRPPQKWKRWLSFCSFSGLDRLHVWNLEEVGTGPTFPPRKMRRGKTLKCILRGRCIRSIIFVRSAYLGSIQQYEADDRDLKRGLPLAS